MNEFVLNMWVMKRINAEKVQSYVTKSFITQADADKIIATTQMD